MNVRAAILIFGLAAILGLGACGPAPAGGAVFANGKGGTSTEGGEVPAQCARIVNPAERRKCLRTLGG